MVKHPIVLSRYIQKTPMLASQLRTRTIKENGPSYPDTT